MRIKMIAALMMIGLSLQAQTNGGELSGRTKTGGRLPVGVDSLAPSRAALMVSDSTNRVYTLATKLKLDSLFIQSNITDGVASANYNGTKILGKVSTSTPGGYTDGRLQPLSLTDRGELRVTSTGAGLVDVYSPSRSADVGDYVSASIDTFGNTRVHDSISWWQLEHLNSNSDAELGELYATIIPTQAEIDSNTFDIKDSLSLIRSQLRSELVDINNYVNTMNSKIPSGLTVNSSRLAIYSPDSIRVFATNGFGGGSSGGTSLDATDSLNLALAGKARATYDSTWTVTAMDTAGLAAKANSATVGWQSDTIGIRQWKATDMKLGVKISFANTAPANDKACYIYACPWWYDGTNWYAASQGTTTLPTGANGTTTIASPNDLVLLGVLSYTTQNQVCQRQFMLSQAFGQTMPDAVSFIIINYTGAAIHTSGNLLYYSLVNRVQR